METWKRKKEIATKTFNWKKNSNQNLHFFFNYELHIFLPPKKVKSWLRPCTKTTCELWNYFHEIVQYRPDGI